MSDVRRATALYREATADPVFALPELQRGVADTDDLVRIVAGIQLAFHHPECVPEAMTRELLNTLLRLWRVSDRSALTAEYTQATDDGEDYWDLGQHIALALACLPAGSAEFAVPELVALWQRDRQFYEAMLAALALAFPEGRGPAGLSEPQRLLLRALVGDDAIWKFCADTVPMLEARGLPGSKHNMQEYLDGMGN